MSGRRLFSALAVLAAVPAFGAPAAWASHQEGLYSGTSTGGGSVEFDVASDAVVEFTLVDVLTSCGYVTLSQVGTPITLTGDHPFSYGGPSTIGLRYSGSFPAPGKAQGTVSYRDGTCTSAAVAWTATTETSEGTGDRKKPTAKQQAAIRKCKKIKNKRKRKRCLKKARKKTGEGEGTPPAR